jgi:hypothetical protein
MESSVEIACSVCSVAGRMQRARASGASRVPGQVDRQGRDVKPAVTKMNHVDAQRSPHRFPTASFPALLPLHCLYSAHLLDFLGDLYWTQKNFAVFASGTPPRPTAPLLAPCARCTAVILCPTSLVL